MPLTNARKKYLRSIGHQLHPVVTVAGKGLSESVLAEINRALGDHELIKVKLALGDRQLKATTVTTICDSLHAEVVQQIGNVALLYRAADKPDPKLSNLLR